MYSLLSPQIIQSFKADIETAIKEFPTSDGKLLFLWLQARKTDELLETMKRIEKILRDSNSSTVS
jgi:hypothetical protein